MISPGEREASAGKCVRCRERGQPWFGTSMALESERPQIRFLAQEGHAAMQVGPAPPFALVSSGICIFIKIIFCSEE